MRTIIYLIGVICVCGVSAKSVGSRTTRGASKNCERLWGVVVNTKDYLLDVAMHVIHDTSLLDDRMPPFWLAYLKQASREDLMGFVLGFGPGEDISDAIQELKDKVCQVADAESFADIESFSDIPLMDIAALVPPAERKAKLYFVSTKINILKEKINDVLSLLADTGYPQFPLQINQADLSLAVNDLMKALYEIWVATAKDAIDAEMTEAMWMMGRQSEMHFYNAFVEAKSLNNLLDMLDLGDDGKLVLDFFFDLAKNRALYLRAFDLIPEWIAAVIDIGLLDLPIGEKFWDRR